MKKQVIFTDGLGNQMFQFALLLALNRRGFKTAINTGIVSRNIVHNGFELFNDFVIEKDEFDRIYQNKLFGGLTLFLLRYMPFLCYKEKTGVFSNRVFETEKPLIYGYWQNELYFEEISDLVRNSFQFRNIDVANENIAEEIINCQSVSIHIRRGDYLKYSQYKVCTPEYYKKAINYISTVVDSPVFYVFSDDLDWSGDFMRSLNLNHKIIDINRGKDSYKDMYLMKNCRHNIIANSSFSWWGAWLNQNKEKIVVAPSKWNLMNENQKPQLKSWFLIY